jgi:hypothetical protein
LGAETTEGEEEGGVMKFLIRFRVIPPYEYLTPLHHIPIEQTYIQAANADEAWQRFIHDPFGSNPSWYRKESIEEIE